MFGVDAAEGDYYVGVDVSAEFFQEVFAGGVGGDSWRGNGQVFEGVFHFEETVAFLQGILCF